jgi:hypothetical protein
VIRALLIVMLCVVSAHADPVTFEISLHVVKDVETPDWLAARVAVANKQFAAVDAAFEVTSQDELDAGATHVVTRADRNALAKLVTDHKIHVFVIGKLENVDDAKVPVHGVTWRADGKKYIIIGADSIDRVLAHELGHVFGLPHSTYPISIMNKTVRDKPPAEDRRFADEEQAVMKPVIKRLAKTLAVKHGP